MVGSAAGVVGSGVGTSDGEGAGVASSLGVGDGVACSDGGVEGSPEGDGDGWSLAGTSSRGPTGSLVFPTMRPIVGPSPGCRR